MKAPGRVRHNGWMRETLKKMFYAALPFLRKAATDAFENASGNKQQPASNHTTSDDAGRSQAPSPATVAKKRPAKDTAQKQDSPARPEPAGGSASSGSDYPGDYHGAIDFEYTPSLDGDADPGEIVWTWVPFEEDHSQGKDRPVVLVGRDGQYLLALMMTSKDHNNREHADRDYLDIGTGPWDAQGRPSEVKLNRVIRVRPEQMRREGAIMPQGTFKQIQDAYTRRNG